MASAKNIRLQFSKANERIFQAQSGSLTNSIGWFEMNATGNISEDYLFIKIDCTTGPYTFSLPDATLIPGKSILIYRDDATPQADNYGVIDTVISGQTIDELSSIDHPNVNKIWYQSIGGNYVRVAFMI